MDSGHSIGAGPYREAKYRLQMLFNVCAAGETPGVGSGSASLVSEDTG